MPTLVCVANIPVTKTGSNSHDAVSTGYGLIISLYSYCLCIEIGSNYSSVTSFEQVIINNCVLILFCMFISVKDARLAAFLAIAVYPAN